MTYETIEVTEDHQGIATLTLARPEKHNALNAKMMMELTQATKDLGTRETVRAVVLAAKGKSFCAGADLNWMRTQTKKDRAGKKADAEILADMLMCLNTLPKPLIGRIEGNAYGGGIGLMAVCDTVIAVDGLTFALTETRLGLIPATIGPFVLRRLSETYARQVFFTSKSFSTDWAHQAGLVSKICKPKETNAAIEEEIAPILKAAPNAVAAAKNLLQDLQSCKRGKEKELTINALAECWETPEAQHRIKAFLERTS